MSREVTLHIGASYISRRVHTRDVTQGNLAYRPGRLAYRGELTLNKSANYDNAISFVWFRNDDAVITA